MMLVLSALGLVQAEAAAPHAEALANGRWKTMSTNQLAAKLLPPELARTVVAHKAEPLLGEGSPLFSVTFYGKPRPTLDGFCERPLYKVYANPESQGGQGSQVRLGGCPQTRDAEFAGLDPARPAEMKAALRWLANASRLARGSQPLPFEIECVAEVEPERCAKGGRAALAELPAENTFIVSGTFNCQPGETRFAVRQAPLPPGIVLTPVWDIRLVHAGKQRPRLQMKWAVPPPF